MKKFVIVGASSAGLISAGLIKTYWKNEVEVSVYYDAKNKGVSVGESTVPDILQFLYMMNIPVEKFLSDTNTTIKTGIKFKDWIPNTEFFHGFGELGPQVEGGHGPEIYSILNDDFCSRLYNKPTTTVPSNLINDPSGRHAFHIDTKEFTDYLFNYMKKAINFVDDTVEKVNVEGENITSIECKNSGTVTADYFIDATGFNRLLFKHLNPKWNDLSDYLPINRAIPQQIPYNFEELPSYTLAEATDNGWIWQIPIRNRYGTGYMYSSRFTSDDEAREKYNAWLLKNFNTELQTDRIIKYESGYYEDYWIGNCLAIGLSNGFIEPLESTGIHLAQQSINTFLLSNPSLSDLDYNRVQANEHNKWVYECIFRFITLHYNTNRTDSEFWKYMTENKTEWVKMFDEKCRIEYMEPELLSFGMYLWDTASYLQIVNGLQMVNKEGLINYLNSKCDVPFKSTYPSGIDIHRSSEQQYLDIKNHRQHQKYVSHKKLIDSYHTARGFKS